VKLYSSKSVLFTIAAVLLTLGLAGCGGSDGGDLTKEDFQSYCSNLKSCIGDQLFNSQFDSVDDCANTTLNNYTGFEGQCASAATDLGRCTIDNFSCDGGQPSQSICEEEQSDFESQCNTGQ
jgi:hypothetical protein